MQGISLKLVLWRNVLLNCRKGYGPFKSARAECLLGVFRVFIKYPNRTLSIVH